jgi:hypothetical protein
MKYTILGPIYPPEKCYLIEVLLWRAFGRFPELQYSDDGEDWRFDGNARYGYEAPIPGGSELSDGECSYAGIPPDPTMQALLEDKTINCVSDYDEWISNFRETEQDPDHLAELKREREEAIALEKAEAEWTPIFDDYVDPFRSEVFLKLRSGTLQAFGTKLPDVYDETPLELDAGSEEWESIPVTEIPSQAWISKGIKWSDSALKSRNDHFIWVHVLAEEMLRLFPPNQLIKPDFVQRVGESFAISMSKLSRFASGTSKRGRPALPWDTFHVEVARRFRDGEMPAMKESAIFDLQQWFQKSIGIKVGRTAIGQKLKPYYDTLFPKDRK